MKKAFLVFASFFGLYLAAMPPALAPYRDAGEMTVSAATLGVSHPTSYPLYILAGRLSEMIPLGNPAYRLTLLSAAGGAAAVAGVFLLYGAGWAGLGAGALLGLNPIFWQISMVPEMYSLWILGAAGLLACALSTRRAVPFFSRNWTLTAFLFGLLLGNRLDLLLWAPGILWIALTREKESSPTPGQAGLWALAAWFLIPAAVVAFDANGLFILLILGTALWLARGPRELGRPFLGLGLARPVRVSLSPSAPGPGPGWIGTILPPPPISPKASCARAMAGR